MPTLSHSPTQKIVLKIGKTHLPVPSHNLENNDFRKWLRISLKKDLNVVSKLEVFISRSTGGFAVIATYQIHLKIDKWSPQSPGRASSVALHCDRV